MTTEKKSKTCRECRVLNCPLVEFSNDAEKCPSHPRNRGRS
jgi:hypothetical protein